MFDILSFDAIKAKKKIPSFPSANVFTRLLE